MRARHTPNTEKLGDSPDFYYLFEDRTDEFNGWDREEDRDSRGSLISMPSLVDSAVLTPRIALDWGLAASLGFHS
jgi:hypothetical protein